MSGFYDVARRHFVWCYACDGVWVGDTSAVGALWDEKALAKCSRCGGCTDGVITQVRILE